METIKFACQRGCINCCTQKGYIYLTEDDLLRAATHLGLSPAEFEAKFVYRTRHLLRLRMRKQNCPFLLKSSCSIHPAKPTQCRLFPFWPELLENRRNWIATSRYCPGINQGELYQIGTALEMAHEMKQAFPRMYDTNPVSD